MNGAGASPKRRASTLLHGTLVFWRGAGLLLRGPSGAGKSDLALRLMEAGGRLVADDQVQAVLRAGRPLGRAPKALEGLMEVRGIGIVPVSRRDETDIDIVVELAPAERIERIPESLTTEILGTDVPLIQLDPREPSALAKLGLAVAARGGLPVIEEGMPRDGDAARFDAPSNEGGRPMQDPRQNGKEAARQSAGERGAVPLVLVTGMSGAGRSTSLKVLEDLGYEAIDNLPLDLMNSLLSEGAVTRPLAVGVDTRSRNFAVKPLLKQVDRLIAGSRAAVTLLFLNCDDGVLQRRFTETRRTHPLAQGRPLSDGLRAERQLVEPLRSRADLVIDTTDLASHDLRRLLTGHLAVEQRSQLAVFVTSFSYRHGVPREADLVFDVRFLANPHYDEVLRPLTGRDRRVAEYVECDPDFSLFFERLTEMLGPLLPRYEAEGKSYLTIAIGCTGGRHRSVAIAEKLAGWIDDQGRQVTLAHRDLQDSELSSPDNPGDAEAGHIR